MPHTIAERAAAASSLLGRWAFTPPAARCNTWSAVRSNHGSTLSHGQKPAAVPTSKGSSSLAMHVRALASSRSTVRKHRGFMVPSGPATPKFRSEVCAELAGALYACHRLSIKAAASAQATYAGVRSSGPSAAALDRSASDSWRSRSSSCHHRRSPSPSCRPGRCRSPGGCIYVAGPPCAAPGKVRRALLELRLERCEERAKTARKGAEW